MATNKRPAPPRSRPVSRAGLKPHDIPGVFRNRAGVMVDEDGVALSFKELKQRDEQHQIEVLGHKAETPADLLKAAAFDPRLGQHVRLDAANKAAGYFSAKRVAVSGVDGAPPINVQATVEAMTPAALTQFIKQMEGANALLEKAATKASK